jgi:hypothetical protein
LDSIIRIRLDKLAASQDTSNMGPAGLHPIISQLRRASRLPPDGVAECERSPAHATVIHTLDPREPEAGVLLGLVAQWVDAGFAGPELVRDLLTRFPPLSAPNCRCWTTCTCVSPKACGPSPAAMQAGYPATSASCNPWKVRIGDGQLLAISNF